MAIPQSFDFDGQAIRPDYVVKCSYGNDSIALLQFLHEYNQKHPLGKVIVLYNDTGWAANWWKSRVDHAEKSLVKSMGFIPCRTSSIGMEALVIEKNLWPNAMMKFCTEELKIRPTHVWLSIHDPEGKAEMVCGVRREESSKRRLWPEFQAGSDKNEGRNEWSPLVYHTEAERNELIHRAGWEVVPHRSRECRCVLANAKDLTTWKESDFIEIEALEARLGAKKDAMGTVDELGNKFMFRPSSKKGHPKGIRAVVEWAKSVGEKDSSPEGGCDSGYCTA